MSSDEISIKVDGLGKRYEIYSSPRDRLKQFILPPVQRVLSMPQTVHYKEHWALRDISFEVKRGESFGIVGRNGSGKSTLLQLITGTLAPTVGIVSTHGRVAALLELGSGFNPDFSGRENVYLNAMLLGMSRDEVDQRFDKIAAFADIGEYLDQPVKTYSSGMLVRLAFAVQVQIDPDILIVDEALAVGDALFQKRCFSRIEKLLSDGVTLLFVSHDQEAVRTLTHRSILLKGGQEVMQGSSSQVLLAYRKLLHEEESAYFASLIPEQSVEPEAEVVQETQTATIIDEAPQAAPSVAGRTDNMSFGDGGMEVISVKTYDAEGEPSAVFYPGDRVRIKVTCRSRITTDRINVSIRIRNREGIKIYSWGTLNQDMQILAKAQEGEIFWKRKIQTGEEFDVWLECDSILGPNLYEIQAAITFEETPDYQAQRTLHWKDEAAFFQALMRQDEYFFGGLSDLRMKATWK
ncbi:MULTISPECIES: ABC transporter ATP-binding protein [Pseudomonas]|uniref:ABC transporter ATP-binding protein n=1 Tax=Pseudomonas nitroreducens TaxID=46680 RepID=UPI001E33D15A|nr:MULTISPECIES: ABC transporter ATP-binding protein [Pseudomonas]MCE4068986.1 ABC transporter ATP-binding protein [Pseudomonas nitritireducens]MCE4078175.1 ABC transporter ATP-binding protein [Pseudomonas nitroreducens]